MRIIYPSFGLECFCGAFLLTFGIADAIKNEREELKGLIEEFSTYTSVLKNDLRQRNNCKYINALLKYFGTERCRVVGSSGEETRIRAGDDNGDFDYLMISEIVVPVEMLEHRKDMPCYVHIQGSTLQHKLFHNVDLVDGKYLPSTLLKTVHPAAFTGLRGIFEIVKLGGAEISDNIPRVQIENEVKPGLSLIQFLDWECDEFYLRSNGRPASDMIATLGIFKQSLERSNLLEIQDVMDTFGKIVDVLQWVLEVTDSDIPLAKTFGPLINAVGGTHNPVFVAKENVWENDLLHSTWSEKKSQSSDKIHHSSNKNEHETITVAYRWKTSKDFIAAFPLSGRPKGLDLWKERNRKWPTLEVVEDIFYNTEFYVVAKPSPLSTQQDVSKEFCLGFNIAEQKLAKALSKAQKNCLLIIKAFKKGHLKKYSDLVTSYHWKTALYWKLEDEDPSIFSDDYIIEFIYKVLDFMIQSLQRGYLEHYFIKSNLFAGMNKETCDEIIVKIYEIRNSPATALKEFIEKSKFHRKEFLKVPRKKMEDARKIYTDPTNEVRINAVTAALGHFTRAIVKSKSFKSYVLDISRKENPIHDAILDVMELALRDMETERQEEARENGKPVRSLPINKTIKNLRDYLVAETSDRKQRMTYFVVNLLLFIKNM